ncbi:MAG: 4-hydroxybenzoate octaprenyltransferase [Dehalococcoidia bacterium]|nr:4-hydroxybenzoate octaprenyltransferase [Dehalococcoidia bacterium]MSQ16467.1 4-hydroxybenzoate octaprenyltransferase [Dehalococcoidia bacterium]
MTIQPPSAAASGGWRIAGKLPLYMNSIRIWESLFALPFAYMGMVLAAQGWPGWRAFIWITLAMFSVRTVGMFANRLIHRKEDAANPRTKDRHLPRGLLQPREVMVIMAVSGAVFLLAAWQLNRLAAVLAPVAAAYVVLYSYAKYYTWACNLILGWALAIAPAGAWIGVTGSLEWPAVLLSLAVACWAGGFDIIYSCTDYHFDKEYGVHSVPRRFGIAGALWIARGLHVLASLALLALGLWLGLNFFYFIGWGIATLLLAYENSLVKPHDLSKVGIAFFRVNSYISVQLLCFTVLSLTKPVGAA